MFAKLINMIVNLQFFAAGDVVNSSVGYTNVNTGVVTDFTPQTPTSKGSTLAPEMKTFYDTELLENTRVQQCYAQFGKTQVLPENHGRTLEFRKWNTFKKADVLQEGVAPAAQPFGVTTISAQIQQVGTYTAVTDILELHAYDDIIGGATEEMAASAAETNEAFIRDGLLNNTNAFYADNVTLATGAVTGATPINCAQMEASSTVRSMLTAKTIAKAVTQMKKNRVPLIGDSYVAVIHPSVAEDLRVNSPDWMEAHKYASPEEIYNGEIGRLHGVRFIESAFAPVLNGEGYRNKAYVGTGADQNHGCTYATFLFGKDAFAHIDPAGGNLQMIVHTADEIGGPLNQWSTLGYKEEQGMVVLYPERVIRIMSCSPYSATDEAN